jgi:hypothetical protein
MLMQAPPPTPSAENATGTPKSGGNPERPRAAGQSGEA